MASRRTCLFLASVALLVALAGCSGSVGQDATPTTVEGTPTTVAQTGGEATSGTTTTGVTATGDPSTATTPDSGVTTTERRTATPTPTPAGPRSDPEEDALGWESGYWYDDPIAVTPADGYNATERDRVVARTMARLERLRELEFTESVTTEVITREQFRERNPFRFEDDPTREQLWEALFAVGEDRSAADALRGVYGGNVAGYYSQGDIVLVSDDPEAVDLDRATLSHELVHALQDQQFGLRYPGGLRDEVLAYRAITEGEANYLMDLYAQRCREEWSCIPAVQRESGASGRNQAMFLSVYLPYSDGPELIADLYERGGWEAVTEAWTDRPTTTEQVIHPGKYPDELLVDVSVPDRSNRAWEPIGTPERVGEAGLFATFVANGVIPESHLRTDENRVNYSHPITAGWGSDALVTYRDGDRFGYVFETAWDSERDARQFHEAYLELLREKGATELRANVYRIDSGPYADAFRVVRDGRVVRIVNAPTVEDLDGIHAPE